MAANHEHRIYANHSLVWVGKYQNLKNISHWHFDHELVACQTGRAVISLDQNQYVITKGQCVFIRGQSIHSILSDENTVLYVALFSEKLLHRITANYCLESPLFNDVFNIAETLEKIRMTDFERGLFYDESCNNLMQKLIIEIFSRLEIKKEAVFSSKVTKQYKNLLYDIDKEIENYTFEKAVDYMHMSEAYFSRFFKKISGMNFSQYLNYIRVNKAIDLIRENEMSMTEISSACGFNTIRSFNRVFRQITGYSPKQLPQNYELNLRSNSNNSEFDPTITTSKLMT